MNQPSRPSRPPSPTRPSQSPGPSELLPPLHTDRVAVYVHFPWCLHRCAYCDFATTAHRAPPCAAYTALVLKELALRTEGWRPPGIRSVFFGGGTPSLWGPEQIAVILAALHAWSPFSADVEISLEANPGALESGDLTGYASAGINRVSIGVQATDDARLRALDRLHDAAAVQTTLAEIAALLASGALHSASADLLFGAPGQTLPDLRADLTAVLDHGLPHLSAYALTVEEGTPLAKLVGRGLAPSPDDDLQSEMLAALPDLVAPWGMTRYEVSNFARPGHEARHNLVYWQGGTYLALGVGAHGFVPSTTGHGIGVRYGNLRSSALWMAKLEAGQLAEAEREEVTAAVHVDELVLTGLRLRDGVHIGAWRGRLGDARCDQLLNRARTLRDAGAPFALVGQHLRVTEAGMLHLDRWLLALLQEDAL